LLGRFRNVGMNVKACRCVIRQCWLERVVCGDSTGGRGTWQPVHLQANARSLLAPPPAPPAWPLVPNLSTVVFWWRKWVRQGAGMGGGVPTRACTEECVCLSGPCAPLPSRTTCPALHAAGININYGVQGRGRGNSAGGHPLDALCQESVGWCWLGGEQWVRLPTSRAPAGQGQTRRNDTIFAAMLVSRWCERAADGLCVDRVHGLGGDAGGCKHGAWTLRVPHCARQGCTLVEYKWCTHASATMQACTLKAFVMLCTLLTTPALLDAASVLGTLAVQWHRRLLPLGCQRCSRAAWLACDGCPHSRKRTHCAQRARESQHAPKPLPAPLPSSLSPPTAKGGQSRGWKGKIGVL